MAREVSRNAQTKGVGGELPSFSRTTAGLPQAFKDAAFSLQPGQTALIHTGGMLPDNADAVVMLEQTQVARPGEIEILKAVAWGENILATGEDVSTGQVVIPAAIRHAQARTAAARARVALEQAELVPQRIKHRETVLLRAPAGSSSLFAEETRPKAAAEKKPKAVLKRSVHYTLRFPDAAMLEAFRKAALDLSRVFPVEAKSLSVTYSRKDEETVRAAIEKLRPQHDFRIEEDRA